MPTLIEKIQNDLTDAQKKKSELNVSTLRFLLSAVKNREIELRPLGKDISDIEVLPVIAKQAKQRKESIVEFQKAGRKDLVEKETAELSILESYLPAQLSEDEVRVLVDEAVSQTEASSISDVGKVMALLMPKVRGKVDGSLVSRLVKERFS